MRKLSTAAAVAIALASAARPAYAQTATTHEQRTTAAPTAATMIQPDEMRASKMIGSTVYDVQNRNIGNVKDLILGKDGKVDKVVLDVGSFLGMGGKYVAVLLSDIKTDHNRLTLDRSKEQLQQMAELSPRGSQYRRRQLDLAAAGWAARDRHQYRPITWLPFGWPGGISLARPPLGGTASMPAR